MIRINTPKQEWMDEIPNSDPLPEAEHIYVLMLLECGPPTMNWLLSPGRLAGLRRMAGGCMAECTDQQIFLQFVNWYEKNTGNVVR